MGLANGKDKTYYEMTPEKALNKLDETFIGDLKLKIVLTNALLKQMPKEPITLGDKTIRNFVFGCPNCKQFTGYKQEYCAYCGQKLDWEE